MHPTYQEESKFNRAPEMLRPDNLFLLDKSTRPVIKPVTERSSVILAEEVLEGWVKSTSKYGVTIELDTEHGPVEFMVKKEDFFGRKNPESGMPIRYHSILQTAPDLEVDSSIPEQLVTPPKINRLTSLPGRPGVYGLRR